MTNELEDFKHYSRFVYSLSALRKYQPDDKEALEQDHYMPKLLVALNICEKYLLDFDQQIERFGTITDGMCSDSEWEVLEKPKKQWEDGKYLKNLE